MLKITGALIGAACLRDVPCQVPREGNSSQAEEKKKAFRYRKAFEIGAGDEIRTHDIHLGKVALYH